MCHLSWFIVPTHSQYRLPAPGHTAVRMGPVHDRSRHAGLQRRVARHRHSHHTGAPQGQVQGMLHSKSNKTA